MEISFPMRSVFKPFPNLGGRAKALTPQAFHARRLSGTAGQKALFASIAKAAILHLRAITLNCDFTYG